MITTLNRAVQPIPMLNHIPTTLSMEEAVRLVYEQGVLIFHISQKLQKRIESLIQKQQKTPLSTKENRELDEYEEIDDYLSFVNRVIRNLMLDNQTNTRNG